MGPHPPLPAQAHKSWGHRVRLLCTGALATELAQAQNLDCCRSPSADSPGAPAEQWAGQMAPSPQKWLRSLSQGQVGAGAPSPGQAGSSEELGRGQCGSRARSWATRGRQCEHVSACVCAWYARGVVRVCLTRAWVDTCIVCVLMSCACTPVCLRMCRVGTLRCSVKPSLG